jgi:hypothetical protein
MSICICIGACGGSSVVASGPRTAPSTFADPPPYTPASRPIGAPGEPTGLSVASGFEQARRMALDLVEAVRVGDAGALSRLLDDRLARALPFVVPVGRSREDVIVSIVSDARRRGLDPSLSLGEMVIAERIEVAPLASYFEGTAPPEGLRSTDLVVHVPMGEAGRRSLRRLLPGWLEHGRVIVRVGATPRIVGL